METVKVNLEEGNIIEVAGQKFYVMGQLKTVAPELNQSIWCVRKPQGKKCFMMTIKHSGLAVVADTSSTYVGEIKKVVA